MNEMVRKELRRLGLGGESENTRHGWEGKYDWEELDAPLRSENGEMRVGIKAHLEGIEADDKAKKVAKGLVDDPTDIQRVKTPVIEKKGAKLAIGAVKL